MTHTNGWAKKLRSAAPPEHRWHARYYYVNSTARQLHNQLKQLNIKGLTSINKVWYNSAMKDNHLWMTAAEVAQLLRLNLNTVYQLAKKRQLPAIRLARRWRFRRQDIENLFNQRKGEEKNE